MAFQGYFSMLIYHNKPNAEQNIVMNTELLFTSAMSKAKASLKVQSKLIFSFSSTSWRLPRLQYSETSRMLPGSKQAPISELILI